MIRFSPHPVGKLCAVTFVDDTDFSTRENTEPVYDLLADHGFWGTKTVWPLRASRNSAFRRDLESAVPSCDTGSTLEDSDYTDFVKKLRDLGFEIALHGVAAGNSTRQEVLFGMGHFRATLGESPSMNVFHQANIENLYCGVHKLDSLLLRSIERVLDRSEYEGHREGSVSFWGDIVRDTFRYVRLPFHTIDEINTLRVNPSMPFEDPRRPYVRRWFASSDGSDVLRFNRLLSEKNVRRLARQRGVCIIYTHFASRFARRGPGGYELDADFVRTVERVTGTPGCWFGTASSVLDRLGSIGALSLFHEGRDLQIGNHSDRALHGVVMRTPADMKIETVDGTALEHGTGCVVMPTIEAGATLRMVTNTAGSQIIRPRVPVISRRERRRIEYMNYLGLVRGALRDRMYYSPMLRRFS